MATLYHYTEKTFFTLWNLLICMKTLTCSSSYAKYLSGEELLIWYTMALFKLYQTPTFLPLIVDVTASFCGDTSLWKIPLVIKETELCPDLASKLIRLLVLVSCMSSWHKLKPIWEKRVSIEKCCKINKIRL